MAEQKNVATPLSPRVEAMLTDIEKTYGIRNRALFLRMGILAIHGLTRGQLVGLMLECEAEDLEANEEVVA